MSLANEGTIIVLTPMGIPFYSSRAVAQTLEPDPDLQGSSRNLRRDIGGTLINLTPPTLLKYTSKISGSDQAAPAFDSVWPGTTLTVWCAATLSYVAGGTPGRPQVIGSSVTANGFTTYRPVLQMMITAYTCTFNEWTGKYDWSLDMKEI